MILEKGKTFAPSGIRTPDHLTRGVVATPTTPFRFLWGYLMALSNTCLWGTFGKQRTANIKICRVCPSARVTHLASRRKNFYNIWQCVLLLGSAKKLQVLLKSCRNVRALYMEPLSLFIIMFQCITEGKTEVSEECFIQNDKTNFMLNTSIFSRNSCSLKNYENHGTCRVAVFSGIRGTNKLRTGWFFIIKCQLMQNLN
jgi:hypothetical protein